MRRAIDSRRRRIRVAAAVVVLGVAWATAPLSPPPSAAADDVVFEMPFPCGEPWHGTTRPGHSHPLAVDFNSYEGEEWEHGHPVLASAAGVVLSAGFEVDYDNYGYTGFGNYVLLDHGHGWTTFYAHLSHIDPAIHAGVPVERGTALGGVGNTGRGSRQHLHYEQARHGRVQRATFGGVPLPWGVDVISRNCPTPAATCGTLAVFADVAVDRYHAAAVQWAADRAITHGVRPGRFLPAAPTTRGEAATFLWRAAGRPDGPADSGFVDVAPAGFSGRPVAWLRSAGLTTGTAPDRFEPDRPITRAEFATLLWRLEGSPAGHPGAGFADVRAGAYHSSAVDWARAAGITTGIPATGLFLPDRPVTRADAVVLLHRHAGEPAVTITEPPDCPSP